MKNKQNLLDPSRALSPLDGRYIEDTKELRPFFSEGGIIAYRIFVSLHYLSALLPFIEWGEKRTKLQSKHHAVYALKLLDRLVERDEHGNLFVSDRTIARVKAIEKITSHDLNAAIEFIKERMKAILLERLREMVHFGTTSMDINYPGQTLALKHATERVYLPLIKQVVEKLFSLGEEFKDIPMLAHTHGQPASPTNLGKEIRLFAERIDTQLQQFCAVPYSTKFGGATGNMNAWYVAYPDKDWKKFADTFIEENLGLVRTQTTTQIEPNDNLAAYCHAMIRINNILLDLCHDMWTYISMEYFKQKIVKKEVGSSAMPHKVNPINFENAEGNLGMANVYLTHFADKLTKSRLQRDLTDSTVMRNMGVPLGHTILALKNILKGLNKILVNPEAINDDLRKHYLVVSEAYQTILRRDGFTNAYNVIKEEVRKGQNLSEADMHAIIKKLDIPEKTRQELLAITPWNYVGNP